MSDYFCITNLLNGYENSFKEIKTEKYTDKLMKLLNKRLKIIKYS